MSLPAVAHATPDLPDGFEPAACPGCGGGEYAPVLESGNPSLGPAMSSMRFRVVRCNGCGLHYTNPRPRLDSLGRFYPDEYSPYQVEKQAQKIQAGQASDPPTIRRLVLRHAFGAPHLKPRGIRRWLAGAIMCFRAPEWFGFGVPWRGRGRLLDFGCGSGKFLRRMSRLGWDCTGIDFSPTAVAAAGSIPGVRALLGTLPHPELAAGSFDVVTLRHALEHVPDPREILHQAWNLLDAGGLLLIQVPNFDSFDIHRFGEYALPLDLPRHLTHFTCPTLGDMLQREGMSSIDVRQRAHANWLRKAARASGQKTILRQIWACRLAMLHARRRGHGNEILATAVKPS